MTVDLIARIPTVEEYEAYFKAPASTRRVQLVDRLLDNPRFNDRWAMFFGDMMNIRSNADGGGRFHQFIKQSIRDRQPYDQMVRQIITATGSLRDNAPVGFFTGVNANPLQVTGILTQTLMGVCMQCAQCHDHPYDVWTQRDYYGLAAYFGSTDVRYRRDTGSLYVIDVEGTKILWPPKPHKGRPQRPVDPRWPLDQMAADEQPASPGPSSNSTRRKRTFLSSSRSRTCSLPSSIWTARTLKRRGCWPIRLMPSPRLLEASACSPSARRLRI